MGFTESLVKVIFWSRVRKARKIGAAAELIGQGQAEETLERLARMERRIPPYLGHLFFLTRGRALDALERVEEAEQSYVAAVFAKEGATIAHVHLAVLCGRTRRFDEARDWLRRIREDDQAEAGLVEQADELEAMLDDVESGRRREALRARAEAFAEAQGLRGLALDEAVLRLDQWFEAEGERCVEDCDEAACFLGERLVEARGGAWELSLSLEDSRVVLGEEALNPFQLVGARLAGGPALAEQLGPSVLKPAR